MEDPASFCAMATLHDPPRARAQASRDQRLIELAFRTNLVDVQEVDEAAFTVEARILETGARVVGEHATILGHRH
jgi:hypothetical protein